MALQYYKKGSDYTVFTPEAYTAIGGANSGFVLVTGSELDALPTLTVPDNPNGYNILNDFKQTRLATYAGVDAIVNRGKSGIIIVDSDSNSANSVAVYIYYKSQKIKLYPQSGGGSATTIVNNLTSTTTGSALDSTQGKALFDLITTLKGGSSVTIATLVSQLATLNAIVTGTTADGDSLVNTIQELLAVFSTYPEGTDVATVLAGKAPLASPSFTGTPTGPTATGGTNTLQLATTAFVTAAINALITAQLTTFNGANQLVKLDGTGKLPAIDASQLTNFPTVSTAPVVQSHTTGATIALANATTRLVINPASTLASLAVTLPATPVNGQPVRLYFGGTVTSGTVVTSLTVTASQGIVQAPSFAPTDGQYGDTYTYEYLTSTSKWYLI